jgi:hypothetical protein
VSADAIRRKFHTVIATNQTVADEPPAGERKGAVRAAIIPCCLVKIPCSSGIISLLVRAGNYPRSRCGAAILGLGNVSERPKPLVSLQNSLLAGILRGDGCDQHCVASQADRVLENFLLWMRKPAKRRLFSSPIVWRPTFELFGSRIPKSLQPDPRKLPFSGDSPWRPWNKPTAW